MILVDTSMIFHRAFSKLDFLKNSKGINTGMEYGTFRILESLEKKFKGSDIILVFDRGSTRRKALDPNYKGNRSKKSEDFQSRVHKLEMILSSIYKTSSKAGEEADEVLHSLSQDCSNCCIYSNDNDLLQSIDDEREIKVIKSYQSKLYFWDEEKVREKYLVGPSMIPIFRAFTGDSSDNITGVPRIPKKFLAEALFYALEHWDGAYIYDFIKIVRENNLFSNNMAAKIAEFIDNGKFILNYQLIRLKYLDVEVQEPVDDMNYIKDFFENLEIRNLKICKKIGMHDIEEKDEF